MKQELTAVIAGEGLLPLRWVEKACENDVPIVVISIVPNKYEDSIRRMAAYFYKIDAGQLEEIFRIVKGLGTSKIVMVGRIGRKELLAGKGLDDRFLRVLSGIESQEANELFKSLAFEFRKENISILEQTIYLDELMAKEGTMAGASFMNSKHEANMSLAFQRATILSDLNIGQTIVMKEGITVAVEALEGTNETIKRSGSFSSGCIVAKTASNRQDLRFDVPVTGIDTIHALIEAKASALILEAEKVIMLDKTAMLELAEQNGIIICGRKRDA